MLFNVNVSPGCVHACSEQILVSQYINLATRHVNVLLIAAAAFSLRTRQLTDDKKSGRTLETTVLVQICANSVSQSISTMTRIQRSCNEIDEGEIHGDT